MKFSFFILGLIAETLAAPHIPRTITEIRAIWSITKSTNATTVQVYNRDKSEFYGEAEGDSITTGPFELYPVIFDVDDNGFGKVTFSNHTYKTRAKLEHSGGAICHKKFSPRDSEVDCILPAEGGFSAKAIEKRTPSSRQIRDWTPRAPLQEGRVLSREVVKRWNEEGKPCTIVSDTVLVGDGDPHQNYLDKQISEVIRCDAATSCSVGYVESQSFTIGWSASATIQKWATFGFDVSETWTTGNTYSCTGETGDEVCIWYNTAHTAITVVNRFETFCVEDSSDYSGNVILKSPNAGNAGGGYYCVIGTCRNQGDEYWDDSGPAGGPP